MPFFAMPTPPAATPPEIAALVGKFAEHRESYHRTGYNEMQLRHDYLNPFFEALGGYSQSGKIQHNFVDGNFSFG